jgi:hypothetical protein
MTMRSRVLLACTAAAIVQVTFFVGYGLLPRWCFCAIAESPQPPTPPYADALERFLEALNLVGVVGIARQVGGSLPATLMFLVVNFLAWALLLFLVLTGGAFIAGRLRRS